MIDHNVMRLHIAVHDALAVAEVKRLEEFIDIEPDIEVVELGIEAPEVGVVDVLEDEGGRLALSRKRVSTRVSSGTGPRGGHSSYLAVPNDVQQCHDVGATREVLEDLDFALNLLLLDGLQNLDDAFLVIDDVDALEDL